MNTSKKFKTEISNLAEIVRCHPEGVSLDELMHITGYLNFLIGKKDGNRKDNQKINFLDTADSREMAPAYL